MCSQFGDEIARNAKASRTHVLYMLATMYAGRQKMYSPSASQSGLLGILSTISVLSMSLLRTSDVPATIATYAVIDVPIIDFISESNGEIYSNNEVGIDTFRPIGPPDRIGIIPGRRHWSVPPKMGILHGDGESGVLMAASCEGTLVGWFSPLATDIMFLSTAYLAEREDVAETCPIRGYIVDETQWQKNRILRTLPGEDTSQSQIIVVQSRGCPALRYAATGFYAAIGEELAIATNDVQAAIDRLEVQGSGVVIT